MSSSFFPWGWSPLKYCCWTEFCITNHQRYPTPGLPQLLWQKFYVKHSGVKMQILYFLLVCNFLFLFFSFLWFSYIKLQINCNDAIDKICQMGIYLRHPSAIWFHTPFNSLSGALPITVFIYWFSWIKMDMCDTSADMNSWRHLEPESVQSQPKVEVQHELPANRTTHAIVRRTQLLSSVMIHL